MHELCLEAHDLLLELADHGVLRVLVDLRLVLDALGAVCVAQRRERLVVVVVCRAEVRHHHRLGVAAQRVLQQARELGVAVGDVRGLAVHERGDHVPQSGEREVNLGRLLEPLARRPGLALPLGACQVDHVELADADVALAVRPQGALLHRDHEDGVRPGGALVHVRGSHAAVDQAPLQDLVHVLDALDDKGLEVLDVNAVLPILEVATLLRVLGEEVPDLLVVDLQVGAAHQVLGGLGHAVDL
mmetsp:Transcript_49217/g.111493  ORF Transcript_49217/g.111493 Transcript_49217/m.111493 type:complete len:244 (-) Transcript_49217:168-899(-)